MKTSLNELRLVEDYLLSKQKGGDQLLFEARLILQPGLKESLYWQQKTYEMIRTYGREQLRREIEEVHQQLFTAPRNRSFKEKVFRIFGL